MTLFSVSSFNVRGLGDYKKRKDVFNYLRSKNNDINILQETHSCSSTNGLWKNEWGTECIFSNGTKSARGIAMLFKKNFAGKIVDTIRDFYGRYILCKMEIADKTYCIVGVYAPNDDQPEFFRDLVKNIQFMDADQVLVGGDFNLVMNEGLDHHGGNRKNNKESLQVLQLAMEELQLTDIWRECNENVKQYTWRRGKPKLVMSRLDMWLVSKGIANKTTKCTINPGYRSDHSIITLDWQLDENKRGPGVWRFNTSLLQDAVYEKEIVNIIQQGKYKYSTCNAADQWEMIKHDIMKYSMNYSRTKAKEKKEDHFLKFKTIEMLQAQIDDDPEPERTNEQIDTMLAEIEADRQAKIEAVAIRCKAQWMIDGEQNSKYFFNLEKRNSINKTMHACMKENGEKTTNPTEILQEQSKFYRRLYSKDDQVRFTLKNTYGKQLTETQKSTLEEAPSKEEIVSSIKSMLNDKTPGIDGFPVEFYKHFSDNVVLMLQKMYMQCYFNGRLSISARRGLLTLIPKKDKNSLYIKNNRPLTMLNTDYKILAKLLATRLKNVLPHLIGQQQTGFMEGRSIEDSIMKTMEVVARTRSRKEQAVIMIIDFEKCFDMVAHDSIYEVLKFFNFGPGFTRWLSLLYSDFWLCTQNNGYTSHYFKKTRGVNQGCNASPLVYLLCSEIMALLFKSDSRIRGITVNDVINILSQFADDTSLYLTYDRSTLEATFEILQKVEAQLGLKISYDKTKVYRVGSLTGANARMYTAKEVAWVNEPIHTLGVSINCDGSESDENFQSIVHKLHKVVGKWHNRKLTLHGKVQIINALMGSLFVYKCNTMLHMNVKQIKEIEGIFRHYLWNGKKDKIPLWVLQLDKKDGGLRLVNLGARQRALKVRWVHRVETDPFLRECAYSNLDVLLRDKIWLCNLSEAHVRDLFPPSFWRTVLEAWACVNCHNPEYQAQVLEQILWYNSNILIAQKPIRWGRAIQAGVWDVRSLWNDTCNDFYTYERFQEIYGSCITWLEYTSLLKAIPRIWAEYAKSAPVGASRTPLYMELNGDKHISRTVYNMLIEDDTALLKYASRWAKHGIMFDSMTEYLVCFRSLCVTTSEIKYRDFQYRLLLGKIFANDTLCKWGITTNDTCTFCNDEKDNIVHMLLDCKHAKGCWVYFMETALKNNMTISMPSVRTVILNDFHENPGNIYNFMALYIKQYIYACRCKGEIPNVPDLARRFSYYYKVSRYAAKMRNKTQVHMNKWRDIYPDGNQIW